MQKSYKRNYDPAHPGFLSGQGIPQVASMVNTADDLPQSFTVQVAAAAGAADYQLIADISGKQTTSTTAYVSFTAAHTAAELAEELSNASNFVTDIYDVATSGYGADTVNINSRHPNENAINALNLVTTGGGAVTITEAQASKSGSVQFGVFAAQGTGDAFNEARPMASGLRVIGATLSTYFVEKDSIGPNAKTEYPSGDAMDIVRKTLSNDGIWMHALQGNMSPADTVHASFDANTVGWVSNNNTNADAVANASVKKSVTLDDGKHLVLVELS